jgi:ERO1-like protein alpha
MHSFIDQIILSHLELTNGQGPYWLKNLYFVYLLELRALTKASSYLERHSFYTGDIEEDIDTLIAIKELFNLFR